MSHHIYCFCRKTQNLPHQGRAAAARWLQEVPEDRTVPVRRVSLLAHLQSHALRALRVQLCAALARPAAESQAQARAPGLRAGVPALQDGPEAANGDAIAIVWHVRDRKRHFSVGRTSTAGRSERVAGLGRAAAAAGRGSAAATTTAAPTPSSAAALRRHSVADPAATATAHCRFTATG